MRSDAGSEPAPPSRSDRGRLVLVVVIVLGVIALDQVTKVWAVAALSEFRPTSIVGTTIELRLSRNTGGAFSLFQQFTPVLAVLAVVVTVVLVRVLQRTHDRVILVALALVLAGAVGNLLDRIFRAPGFLRGAVVDFIGIDRFPTFNVADSAITIGAVLLVLWGWRRESAID